MLRSLTAADIPELEHVQTTSLPGSLPTLFGSRFFRLYHTSLMSDPRFLSCGFFDDARMAGFLTYTTDSAALFPEAFRRYLLRYVLTVAGALVTRPRLIGTTLKLLPGLAAPGSQPGRDVPAELLSYGVLPEYRRRSAFFARRQIPVAANLIEHAFAELRSRGSTQVKIFVQTESADAFINHFYVKHGFKFVSRAKRFGMLSNCYVRDL